jgi:hypothetical protein
MTHPLPAYGGIPAFAAVDSFAASIEILPAGTVSLINPLVYTNAGSIDRDFCRRLFWQNAARDEPQPPVILGRYAQAHVTGAGPFMLISDHGLVREHIPGNLAADHVTQIAANLCAAFANAVDIREECVFACHAGLWVWGHWLVDILPRILLAERIWPGRFRYAMPRDLIAPPTPGFYSQQVKASLAAYKIPLQRLLLLDPSTVYRFHALHDVAGMRDNDTACHPGLLSLLRDVPDLPPQRRRRGITAVLRGVTEKRALINRDEIVRVLNDHGAGQLDPGAAPFLTQILAFRDSEIIVGDMGSNLTAALYGGPGHGIAGLAPNRWDDGFLPRLLQSTDLFVADLRGATAALSQDDIMRMPYRLDPKALAEGLGHVMEIVNNPPKTDMIEVAGRNIARRMGGSLLTIAFGSNGNAGAYPCQGFSGPEPGHAWSIGPSSRLSLSAVPVPQEDCWLDIYGVGYAAPPRLPETELAIEVNGVRLARFDVSELTRLQVLVPRDVLARRKTIELIFHHPICPPLNSVSDASDDRPLGFCFRSLSLRRVLPHGASTLG